MSDDLLDIEINGRALKARKGAMIIEVADEAGLLIPRFCYHKKLSIAANCRMCLVEVEKAPKPLPACATPVMDGMIVKTKSALAIRAQKSVMEFLLINHPLDCPICDQGGECELQDVAMGYGRGVSRFNERKRVVEDKNLGPLISTDMTRCIHCTRCVRFGEEIGGMPELGVTGRGEDVKIGTFIERNVNSELSGNVIDVCPVGALTSKPFRYLARAWEISQKDTISAHDAIGSNLHVHIKNGKVVRIVPKENEAINEVWLTDRDRFSYEGLYSDDRLTQPMVKREGNWVTVDWSEAIEVAAEGLRTAIGNDPEKSLGTLLSPNTTTEEAFLLQKLVRGLGSNNIDHRLRRCDFRGQENEPVALSLGTSLGDLEKNNATLLIGCDSRREQPLVNHRLRKSVVAGGSVSAVNSVEYDLNFALFESVVVDPGAMVRGVAEIAAALGVSHDALANVSPSDAASRIAAQLREANQGSVILGLDAQANPYFKELYELAQSLAKQANVGFGCLTSGANSAGVSSAGALPHRSAGGGVTSPAGMNATEMLNSELRAWLLLGVEPELDCHDSAGAANAMKEAGFVVSLVSHLSEVTRGYADVVLPIAPFAENIGSYVNGQGDKQSFVEAVPAQGESRAAWKVLRVLGNAFELDGFDYVEIGDIRAELKNVGGGQIDADDASGLPSSLPNTDATAVWRLGSVPIYSVDSLVRRASALQATNLAGNAQIRLNSSTGAQLGLTGETRATACQNGACVTLELVVDESVADNCVCIPSGLVDTASLGPSIGAVELAKA